MRPHFISVLITFFSFSAGTFSQPVSRYNTLSYGVNEGLLQTTIGDAAFDRNNFCWISFPNGIQKFDGKTFTNIPVQQGLPDDKHTAIIRDSNGDILISHTAGISRYDAGTNKIELVYTYKQPNKMAAEFIGEDDGNLWLYTCYSSIIGLDKKTYSLVSETKTGFPDHVTDNTYAPRVSDRIVNHRSVLIVGSRLLCWDLKNKKILYDPVTIPGIARYNLHHIANDEVLFFTYGIKGAVMTYNFTTKRQRIIPLDKNENTYVGRCFPFKWGTRTMLALNGTIFETDSSLQRIEAELVNFQNSPIVQRSGIGKILEDNFGNLLIFSISNGITKIFRNNYPVRFYHSGIANANFVLSVLPDKKNNRVLVGAIGAGIYVYDTLQRLVKQIRLKTEKKIPESPNVIVKTVRGDYVVFLSGEKAAQVISSDLSHITSINPDTGLLGIGYFGKALHQDERYIWAQTQENLFRIDLQTRNTFARKVGNGYMMSGLYHNGQIITHVNNELIWLDATTFSILKKIPFPNTSHVRCFATGNNGHIYIGCNKGIFETDNNGKVLAQYNKATGLPDECIYAIVFDENNTLWCSTNKGILKINPGQGLQQLKKEDGLQENEFNTNCVAKAEDGELFFGGINGVSSFNPSAIGSFEEKLSLLFTGIRANNKEVITAEAPWNVSRIVLPYNQSSLEFDFVAMGNSNPDQYVYQYRMTGLDNEWIQTTGPATIRYSLPPGRYVLKIVASRSFDKEAKPMDEIIIIIRPPFWKSWWFITLAIITLLAILATLINQRNKRKYARQLQLLEQERQLKLERERISKDLHDSLGAYAHVMLYKTELLEQNAQNRSELISDLKFASKDIITSLRETVWALKKDEYTADECLVRIRNFIQPFSRYYDHIQFTLEGEAPAGMKLHYTKALNAVRIVQEAISNSIKHASPKNVKVWSETLGSRWKITITDDGKGFDYLAMKEMERGNGLNNIEHRAAESAFELTIKAGKDKGTIISIII